MVFGDVNCSFRPFHSGPFIRCAHFGYDFESHVVLLFNDLVPSRTARVMIDRDTNRPKGFGFVTMDTPKEADDAAAGMNGVVR